MSAAKENSCRKFQANFFNKSKCQNCFKPRELHLLTDQDLTQAKPIYAGWLCLAPEGTNFDNPMQRSRKWQRRFFVLYEHGCLRFALDESPSTLPQGTVNMNLCSDVIDAEPKTGQKNSLCIITPEQEYFIRGENKEIINGWSEQLIVYPRTNKQNQKKKRKVEPTTSQEPGPAKVAVTGSGIPEADKAPDSSSIIWQEELNQREAESAVAWAAAGSDQPPGSPLPSSGDCVPMGQGSDGGSVNGDEVDRSSLPLHGSAPQAPGGPLSPTGSCSSLGGVPRCQSPSPSDPFPSGSSLLSNGSHISGSVSSLDSDASGSTVTSTDSHPAGHRGGHHDAPRSRRLEAEARKAEKRSRFRSPDRQEREAVLSPERSRSGVIEKFKALELENPEKMEVEETERNGARQGRSEHRRLYREGQRQDNNEGLDFRSTLPPLRRAKSLDRRTTESVMTPDLLNFKKGWMVKLDEQGQWKKYWFVLTDHSLRYYKDSIAEEASDLDGEIDLSSCYNVTEYQAQRNYGFQIHTQEGVHTLSAMTAGIRRNWIQAVMKNVRPSTAPDVASSTDDHGSFSAFEGLARPDVAQPSSDASSVERESAPGIIKSRARERRREGRSKTFDWAEFRPIAQALAQQRAQEAESLQADRAELDRSRRREERRKRYEGVSSPDHTSVTDGGRIESEVDDGVERTVSASPTSLQKQQRVEEVIEEHWRQVEKTPIREERRVPLPNAAQSRETTELELLLDSYKQGIEDLKAQLESCHQQLLDSNKHKQELELQLRIALEREQDIRSGYISPATCERGFAAMEESHQKVIEELQRKHQRELENLKEEKERLLEEETAATIAAIEAMKNAHRTELEKELDKARKASSNNENADIEEIRRQHEEELCSFQREIEVLSEQYSQKCLENAHLAQALEAERQALRQCQRENQELNAHNQELNNRLAAEITKMRSMTSEDGAGDPNVTIQGKELYELEVMLRVKESEVQYLKQEINSLKDELQAAQRDKKYATDKYKDIYTELSIVKAKAERDLGRLREQLQLAHEALGEPSLEDMERGYDIMKSKSNPDILKMAAAAAKRSERTLRSKSLKEGLTAEQRLHLFENKDAKEF
ncbi:PREDICTED: myosin phosphatase Rho-interacting protein-like isoform X3 [Cyprinodon variegatus]|uniref:Myosin phosphatase Rho interacting protein n=1 Tax=Cyprinodon variegatus TaxID=28743 RepID=A0A3Q2EEU1_CYPVA|nr:PREDICTED: myosin phosphatase Rho-interacting protein-like isoform X3 [Cyprinodon variegatus]